MSEEAHPTSPPKTKLRASAIMGVAEQLVIGLSSLAVYTLIIRRLGSEDLGAWSLILTIAAVAQRLPTLGGAPLFHHLSSSEGQGQRARSVAIVETAFVSTVVLYLIFCLVGYYPFLWFVRRSLPATYHSQIDSLTLGVFVSIFLGNVSNVYLYALGGVQKMYIRSVLNIAGTLLMFIMTYVLLEPLGVISIAYGLIAQQGFLLVIAGLYLRRFLPQISLILPRFNLSEARNMLKLGLTNFVDGLTPLFWEPLTRVFLGSLGALASISAFTVAWRLALLPRSFIYSAVLALSPAFGSAVYANPEGKEDLQRRALEFATGCTPLMMAATVGASPIVSEIMFSAYQPDLVLYVALISCGFYWESLALVFFYRSLGEGRMSWSVTGTVTASILNASIGGIAVKFFGATGAIAWLAISLSIGSMVILFGNQYMYGVGRQWLFSRANGFLNLASIAAAMACLEIYWLLRPSLNLFAVSILMLLGALAIVSLPALRHPLAKSLLGNIRKP